MLYNLAYHSSATTVHTSLRLRFLIVVLTTGIRFLQEKPIQYYWWHLRKVVVQMRRAFRADANVSDGANMDDDDDESSQGTGSRWIEMVGVSFGNFF